MVEAVDLTTGAVYLAIDFCFVVVVGAAQSWYATDPRRDLMPDLSDADRGRITQGNLSAVILAIVALILSPIVGTLSFAVFALDPFLTARLPKGLGPTSGQP